MNGNELSTNQDDERLPASVAREQNAGDEACKDIIISDDTASASSANDDEESISEFNPSSESENDGREHKGSSSVPPSMKRNNRIRKRSAVREGKKVLDASKPKKARRRSDAAPSADVFLDMTDHLIPTSGPWTQLSVNLGVPGEADRLRKKWTGIRRQIMKFVRGYLQRECR